MKISISQVIGCPLFFKKKEISKCKNIFFEEATGKITGILSDQEKFYLDENILIEEDRIDLLENEKSEQEGVDLKEFQVVSRKGIPYGKIRDIEITPESSNISHILVKADVFGISVPMSEHQFPFSRIYEVDADKKKIVIDDDTRRKVLIKNKGLVPAY